MLDLDDLDLLHRPTVAPHERRYQGGDWLQRSQLAGRVGPAVLLPAASPAV
ncbi:MAG: hypothetical protein JWN17_1501 [Frankiales bacterium]|nr:hypothetical protein [Frankiales bacterium]